MASNEQIRVLPPEPKLDTIIIITRDTIPQYYFIYDYE